MHTNKQNTRLELVVNKRVARYNYLPLAPTRERIFEEYMDGYDERGVAQNLKIPVAQVRLVLRGWQEIYYRLCKRAGANCPAWKRQAEAEISAEIWKELERTTRQPPPAVAVKRAA